MAAKIDLLCPFSLAPKSPSRGTSGGFLATLQASPYFKTPTHMFQVVRPAGIVCCASCPQRPSRACLPAAALRTTRRSPGTRVPASTHSLNFAWVSCANTIIDPKSLSCWGTATRLKSFISLENTDLSWTRRDTLGPGNDTQTWVSGPAQPLELSLCVTCPASTSVTGDEVQ